MSSAALLNLFDDMDEWIWILLTIFRALYMQADMKKDTEDWLTLFNKAFLV